MKLHEFLQSTYMTLVDENQKNPHPFIQGKIQAVTSLINVQRSTFKFFNFFNIFFHYISVLLKLSPAPKSIEQIYTELLAKSKEASNEASTKLTLVKSNDNN